MRKAEVHLTYRCNLSCINCNRGCFAKPHTPDMSVSDYTRFLGEVRALGWKIDLICLIGGEPTLHKDIMEFVKISWNCGHTVSVFSNGFNKESWALVKYVIFKGMENGQLIPSSIKNEYGPEDFGHYRKTNSIYHTENPTIFFSPLDLGIERTNPCHLVGMCGFSVDALGYTACSLGGMVSSVTCPEARTKKLSDLQDKEFLKEHFKKLCKHCGSYLESGSPKNRISPPLDALYELNGVKMTKTWYEGFLNVCR